MPQQPVHHRCADGSIRFTHCDGEYDAALDAGARLCVARPGRRGLGGPRLLLAGLGTATAAFWSVMLLSPPVTEAFNTPARLASCIRAAGEVAPWFEREIQRRAGLGNAAFERGGFKLMLLDFRAAQGQCAAGDVVVAAHGFRLLTERVVALSEPDER